MAEKITLKLYVVVDHDGEYAVSNYDMDNAESLYEDEYGGNIVSRYEVDLIVPKPLSNTIRVKVAAPDQERSGFIPEPFGNVRVLPPED